MSTPRSTACTPGAAGTGGPTRTRSRSASARSWSRTPCGRTSNAPLPACGLLVPSTWRPCPRSPTQSSKNWSGRAASTARKPGNSAPSSTSPNRTAAWSSCSPSNRPPSASGCSPPGASAARPPTASSATPRASPRLPSTPTPSACSAAWVWARSQSPMTSGSPGCSETSTASASNCPPGGPRDLYARYHALIVMHCKHLCQKRAPLCRECELRNACAFHAAGSPEGQARG